MRIVDPERGAVVVFEIRFGQVAVQMRLTDMMELAIDSALEQANKAFDGICMVETASANVLVSRMVDGPVTREFLA